MLVKMLKNNKKNVINLLKWKRSLDLNNKMIQINVLEICLGLENKIRGCWNTF